MKNKYFVSASKGGFGQMPDDTIAYFQSEKAYDEAYENARKKLEDEIADELFRLENEYEIDDLYLDYACGGMS